jgi:adenylate cyclase
MEKAPERKLTTILAADVAGYSAMMGRDEPGTLARLKTSRAVIAEKIAAHRGRLVGISGDSVLAEFASVVNAVECAVRIQREIAERNSALAEDERMRFRIGINLGDVMVEGDDLFGEGVNIAARLEALAEPGGILISGAVFDQVRSKLALGFDFLGPQPVKNIAEPVPTWRVVLDAGEGEGPPSSTLGRFVSDADDARHGKAERRAARRRYLASREGLKRRALLVAIPIAIVFVINILTWSTPSNFWFQWPTLGFLIAFAIRTAWVTRR